VIGAVLRSQQGAALHQGVLPAPAFLDGYHAGLAVTTGLILVGVLVSFFALRRLPTSAPAEPVPVPAADQPNPELTSSR
jgi:hypothetical protein